MISEVVLTPNQAKRVIAKAILRLPYVKKALENGLVVIHPSSTTYFILYELFGEIQEGIWVLGVIKKGALCISRERQEMGKREYSSGDPFDFPFSWVIEKGVLKREGIKLGILLNEMGPGDIYIKGCNAIDCNRQAGVLFASPRGGTITKVMRASKEKGFRIILPVGLEKLISLPIKEAAKYAPYYKIDKSMGQRVGLIPVRGEVISEDQALSILTGAQVTHLASGGLEEAQGASILVVQGEEDKITALWKIIDELENEYINIPIIRETKCKACTQKRCSYYGNNKKL